MSDPVSIAKALADVGGWTAFLVLGVAVIFGFARGWVLPRFIYDREVTRGDRLQELLDRSIDRIDGLIDEIRDRRRPPGA